MKKAFLSVLVAFIWIGAFAQGTNPNPQKKSYPIHDGKRELRHESNGKHHDYKKPKHHDHKQPAHHRIR